MMFLKMLMYKNSTFECVGSQNITKYTNTQIKIPNSKTTSSDFELEMYIHGRFY